MDLLKEKIKNKQEELQQQQQVDEIVMTQNLIQKPIITPSSFLYNIKNIYHSQSPILLQITKLNIQLIYDYLSEIKNNHIFQFIATVHISNFKELIETKNIYCFVLMYKQKIYASYFLKNTFMEIEKGGGELGRHTTISCFASIKDNDYDTFMDYSFCQTFYQIIQIYIT